MKQPLHTVDATPFPCPGCGSKDCQVSVYDRLAIRECNYTHAIPPIHRSHHETQKCEVCRG